MNNIVNIQDYINPKPLVDQSEDDIPIDQFADAIAADTVCRLISEYDVDLKSNPNAIHEILMITELVKSLYYRGTGQVYPTQDVVDTMYSGLVKNPQEVLDAFFEIYVDNPD